MFLLGHPGAPQSWCGFYLAALGEEPNKKQENEGQCLSRGGLSQSHVLSEISLPFKLCSLKYPKCSKLVQNVQNRPKMSKKSLSQKLLESPEPDFKPSL